MLTNEAVKMGFAALALIAGVILLIAAKGDTATITAGSSLLTAAVGIAWGRAGTQPASPRPKSTPPTEPSE